jgi:phosphatidylserine decarboxylase
MLEVGPGTGVVTAQIVQRMGPSDFLELVELNDRFVAALHDRLQHDPSWRQAADRIRIHHMSVEQLVPNKPFDVMVSGLPFNNFPAELVRSILGKLEAIAAPNATLSFFEYIAVRQAKALAASPAERRRLAGVEKELSVVRRRWQFGRDCVLANVPPAWVHNLRFGP